MIGTLLGGRWRVVAPLGAGGMASVWRVRDERDGRELALKLLTNRARDVELERRFQREFQLCARFEHPGVVRLHDLGRAADGSVFYTMDLLAGSSLAERLEEGPLALDEARPLLVQLGEALGAIHRAGLVHRDVKPGNVMLVDGGRRAVVMDFGLARDPSLTAITATGQILGTPAYMSPELLEGAAVDARSDVWQLGCVAYETLSGRRPFDNGAAGAALCRLILHEPPGTLPSSIAPGLRSVILRCLDKSPARRYPDGAAAAAAFAADAGATSWTPAVSGGTPAVSGSGPRRPGRAQLASGLVLGLGVGLVALLALGAWPGAEPDQEQAPASLALARTRAPVAPLRLSLEAARTCAEGLALTWRAPGARSRVLPRGPGGRDLPPVEARAVSGAWEATLPGPPAAYRGLLLEVTQSSGAVATREVRALLEDALAEPEEALARGRPPVIARRLTEGASPRWADVLDRLAAQPATQAATVVQSRLAAQLDGAGLRAPYARVAGLSALALGTGVLPFERRRRLYQLFAPYLELGLFAAFHGAVLDPAGLPDLGEFAMRLERTPGASPASEVLAPGSPAVALGVDFGFSAPGTVRSWSTQVVLGAPSDLVAAELELEVEHWLNLALGTRVNDGPTLYAWNGPLLPYQERRTLWQRVPVALLRAGTNRLQLSVETVLGHVNDRRIIVRRATLRVLRAPTP